MIKVLLVDDHQIVRHGLKITLEADDEIEVVGECADGKQALEAIPELKPDVAVIDISMPVMDGVTATHQIVRFHPDTKVLILTMHRESRRIKEMADIGAAGFLTKDAAPDELATAIKTVARGDFYLQPEIASTAFRELVAEPRERSTLSERELDVVRLAAQGLSMGDVGDALCISPRTAQTHLYHAMKKLGLHTRHELIYYAVREGLVIAPE